MKIGDKRCNSVNCELCPFNKNHLLKVCTSFKLNDPLKLGLASELLTEKELYIFTRLMNKDYEELVKERREKYLANNQN